MGERVPLLWGVRNYTSDRGRCYDGYSLRELAKPKRKLVAVVEHDYEFGFILYPDGGRGKSRKFNSLESAFYAAEHPDTGPSDAD
jgi:hypothetical protein